MTWQTHFEKWNQYQQLDSELRDQLKKMSHDEKKLEDCFYKNLEFGTGGMRGILGPGTNRMNIYTVMQGNGSLAQYIISKERSW